MRDVVMKKCGRNPLNRRDLQPSPPGGLLEIVFAPRRH